MAQALGLLPRHIRRELFFTSTAGAFVVLVACRHSQSGPTAIATGFRTR